jgi:gentisate 1,2-dioxygenase
VQGSGRSKVGNREFDWHRGDMIAAPGWNDQLHAASEDTVLARVSDEPLMRMLGWYHTGQGMAAAKGETT